MKKPSTVSIAGLGAIGLSLAKSLDQGKVPGFRLLAVCSRDPEMAKAAVANFDTKPRVCFMASDLAEADLIIEAAPAAAFLDIAGPAIAAGKILVACSAGALMRNMRLVEEAECNGARIIIPTGAIIGLDAVRAAAQGNIVSCMIETRKSPRGWVGAPYLAENAVTLHGLTEAKCIFEGNTLEAAAGFPANANVAAALAMAGVGPLRTKVRLIADPAVERNIHHITVESDVARFSMTIESMPDPVNPRTSMLTPLSVIACLRSLHETFRVGS